MHTTKYYLVSLLILLFSSSTLAANWGYSGQNTHYPPEKWSHLKGASLCSKGKQQSPINIASSEVAASGFMLKKEYGGNYVEISNNGHAVIAKAGRYIEIEEPSEDGGDSTSHRYKLAQFHFHTLSEHTVSLSPLDTPKHYDMELHLVHISEQGRLAVLGIFIEEGDYNETLGGLFENLPKSPAHDADKHGKKAHGKDNKGENKTIAQLSANYENLLPTESDLFVYQGSLTTPPCSEGVQWMVFVEPIQMSRQQIQSYRALYSDNGVPYHTNRPVQQLNHRLIRFGSSD